MPLDLSPESELVTHNYIVCAGATWLRGVLGTSQKKVGTGSQTGTGAVAELGSSSGHNGESLSLEKPLSSASSEQVTPN